MCKRVINILTFCLIWIIALTSTAHGRWLIVNSIPGDAQVLVNDIAAGMTPVKLEGKENESITITVKLSGLNDYSFAYDFKEDKVIFLDLNEGVELDEATYWQKKTSDNTRQVQEMLPTATPEPVIALPPEVREVGNPGKPSEDLIAGAFKGLAVYEIEVKANGKLGKFELKTIPPEQAVKKYLDDWVDTFKFNPATENSKPVKQSINIRLVYNLEEGILQLPDFDQTVELEIERSEVQAAETEPTPVLEIEPTPVNIADGSTETSEMADTNETDLPVENSDSSDNSENESEQTTVTQTDKTPEATSVPDPEEKYYTKSQVDRPAKVFTPPSVGNVSVDIINLNLKGSATFNVNISETGDVDSVGIIQSTGNDKLDEYVTAMIKKSFWEAAKKGGNTVKYTRPLKLEFYTLTCRFDFLDIFE